MFRTVSLNGMLQNAAPSGMEVSCNERNVPITFNPTECNITFQADPSLSGVWKCAEGDAYDNTTIVVKEC